LPNLLNRCVAGTLAVIGAPVKPAQFRPARAALTHQVPWSCGATTFPGSAIVK